MRMSLNAMRPDDKRWDLLIAMFLIIIILYFSFSDMFFSFIMKMRESNGYLPLRNYNPKVLIDSILYMCIISIL